MSILTTQEIEKDLKRRKVTKSMMPEVIHQYIVDALEDSGDDAFRTGKEEGRAELMDELDNEDPIEDGNLKELEFAISILESMALDGCSIQDKLTELTLLKCRYL